jgi:non-ribosomal peptide synthase protein (TIGR01720 family)
MIIHHLVVDGISWRVLLEDLQSVYRQLQAGANIQFPPKTSSFRSWVEALQSYANSSLLKQQADYWIHHVGNTPLPRDFESEKNIVGDVDVVTVSLDEENTQALLQDVPKASRVSVHEKLLFGLAKALGEWTGHKKMVVEVEGHGREEIGANSDVSRTMGWFTTRYPIVLPWNKRWDINRQLAEVKETVHSIPNAGIGYGVLRYLAQEPHLKEALANHPEICFNYLGQFDQMFDDHAIFTPGKTSAGHMQSPLGKRSYLMEVVALVVQGRLQINWGFNRNIHARETIQRVADRLLQALQDLIVSSHSVSEISPEIQNVDVEGISQEELGEILDDVAHT